MKISEAAKQAKLSTKTVRYYADIGLVVPDVRANKYRDYDRTHVQKLIFARRAHEFGFSIEECRDLLDLYQNTNRSSSDVKRLASARLADIKRNNKNCNAFMTNYPIWSKAVRGTNAPIARSFQILQKVSKRGAIFLLTLRSGTVSTRCCYLKIAVGDSRKVWQGTVTPSRRRTLGSIPRSPTTYFSTRDTRPTLAVAVICASTKMGRPSMFARLISVSM